MPSGNSNLSQGFGSTGAQTNLLLSVILNRHLVTHWNAGATFVPHARNSERQRASAVAYNFGQSVIWETTPRFNVMMKPFFGRADSCRTRENEMVQHVFLTSGIRWAYNFKNGLQIVPGIAMPIGVGPSAGDKGVFLYLSFEHPFR